MSGIGLLNVHNAFVADAKVRDYLLDPAHPNNGGKALFFQRFGFTHLNWTILQDALRIHPQVNPVSTSGQPGKHYCAEPLWGPLRGKMLAAVSGRSEPLHQHHLGHGSTQQCPEAGHRIPVAASPQATHSGLTGVIAIAGQRPGAV